MQSTGNNFFNTLQNTLKILLKQILIKKYIEIYILIKKTNFFDNQLIILTLIFFLVN